VIPPISGAIGPISGAIGPLGPAEWSIAPVDPLSAGAQAGTSAATATSGASGSFGSALSGAIDSLEQSQAAGTNAAQALATGHLSDPTKAVTAVENAALEMQFAGQIRTKLDDVATNIFQTQA
jgi:flagellar hook-basal body complex protein FliE